jgi:hypothetical protein
MKESVNNTLTGILNNEIIMNSKSSIHDYVSGVKNLFHYGSGNAHGDDKIPCRRINNYLKSPEEMDAELWLLTGAQENDYKTEILVLTADSYAEVLIKSGRDTGLSRLAQIPPGFLEENY